MRFIPDFETIKRIREARKKRQEESILQKESVFLRETNKQIEWVFFWRVLTLSTLGLFFFSIVDRFAMSASHHLFIPHESMNTPQEEIIFLEDGFVEKPEVWTEVGDRSDVGGVIDYVVVEGDTLSEIAKRFAVTESTIIQNNTINNPKSLKIGSVIKVPAADGLVHIVKKGESIGTIAQKYTIDQEKILSQNQKNIGDVLKTGEQLIIPGAKKPKVVARPRPRHSGSVYGSGKNVQYAKASTGRLLFPTQGQYTQGYRYGHYAVDIAKANGAQIWAAESGTVIKAQGGWNGGYGNMIVIDHGNGLKTLYAHNKTLYVKKGDIVSRGQPIALMGNTGRVYGRTGIHLHFEVIEHGRKRNPVLFF